MTELSPEARSLIESAHQADDPTANDRERIKGRLAMQLGAAAFTAAAVSSSTAAAAGAGAMSQTASAASAAGGVKAGLFASLGGLGKVLVTASLVGTLGATGVLTLAGTPEREGRAKPEVAQPRAQPVEVPREAPKPATIPEPVVQELPSEKSIPTSAPAPVVPAVRKVARSARPSPEASPATSDLSAELALLNGAQWALRQGQAAQALSMAREHETRFPQGALGAERAGIEALARCALGHEGARVVEELARVAPDSPVLARAKRACGVE
jgi:hypothetical protein